MKKFEYLRPKTLDEAISLLNQYGKKATLIAGGTDVIVMAKQKKMTSGGPHLSSGDSGVGPDSLLMGR